jgi:hypothetical protein
MLEEYHARTCNTVVDAITPISEHFWPRTPLPPQATTINHKGPVCDLRTGLVPHEPIDYDLLMMQLS